MMANANLVIDKLGEQIKSLIITIAVLQVDIEEMGREKESVSDGEPDKVVGQDNKKG